MKVEILKICSMAGRALAVGDVADLPDDVADSLIGVGAAELAPDDMPLTPWAGPPRRHPESVKRRAGQAKRVEGEMPPTGRIAEAPNAAPPTKPAARGTSPSKRAADGTRDAATK
jgi:hypothetical protein